MTGRVELGQRRSSTVKKRETLLTGTKLTPSATGPLIGRPTLWPHTKFIYPNAGANVELTLTAATGRHQFPCGTVLLCKYLLLLVD